MENLNIVMVGLIVIIFFIFGFENFFWEIESILGECFCKLLSCVINIFIFGVLIGVVVMVFI